MSRYSRSPSQLKSVTGCGHRFYLERLTPRAVRPPKRPAAWLALGIALHTTFQRWEEQERQLDKEEVIDLFVTEYDQEIDKLKVEQPDVRYWMTPPNTKSVAKSIDSYRKRGSEKDVPLYLQRCLEADWEVLLLPDGTKALELPFELEFGDVTVRGYLDRIQWWPNEKMAAIEDTKTGQADDDDYDPRQLGVYAFAARECYGINVTHGRYWYTKLDRGSEWFDLSRFDYEMLGDDYNVLDTMINQGLLLPKPGKGCFLCGVRPWCKVNGYLKLGEKLFDEEVSGTTD